MTAQDKLIRAADYLPTPEQEAENAQEPNMYNEGSDGVLFRLFGTLPDYQDAQIDALWKEVFDADEQEMIAYCKEQGVDVLQDDGTPVAPWRDIAVVLKALDKGLMQRA
jgi:hypothetical protein